MHENYRNHIAEAGASKVHEMSLHSDDPEPDGSNEISGGNYSRQPVNLSLDADGTIEDDSDIVFEIPEGTTVRYGGLWDDAGNWLGSDDVPEETFNNEGTYIVEKTRIKHPAGS